MNTLRNIPAIDEILLDPRVKKIEESVSRELVVKKLREVVENTRTMLRNDNVSLSRLEITDMVVTKLQQELNRVTKPTLNKVINATGVVLHTNLGRALLAPPAVQYLTEIAGAYVNLEIDLDTGERGSRYVHVEDLLINITGAEAALVVNNNAAAVLLVLNTMANGRDVIVSRGQLVEIGGSFRIPEVMKASGARLVEVGTTNKTYLRDYEEAIDENTALLLTVHPSNYRILGFTSEVTLEELAELGRKTGLPVVQDLGSGVLCDLKEWGLPGEPTVKECIARGADVVTFSGDKLLGGPQAGIIVGKRQHVEAMKRNQLTRALRVDKLTIAALEATLVEYLAGKPNRTIPTLQMLTVDEDTLHDRAQRLCGILTESIGATSPVKTIQVVSTEDRVGGGAYPTHGLPGFAVEVVFDDGALTNIARALRLGEPAILTRLRDNAMLFSVRTLLEGDYDLIATRIREIVKG
ncbi:MAG: L-seryl-tRNA(Sec) selenium transferase [Syntrophothermus sp.]|uniref:L-seryl-tRNA(Sec) selenium transferase n=1 Tax=Syntrophothermus sp. TaxID=2736299 RepID=UPI00258110B6|nr:L-seryl-tRNA(Sec) selenium transferase [Syntrophothermus sp.]NSW83841.1 L-seryl-tRNA(Sec) selenium transferase [Syntrophothermus sp.]